MTFSLRLLPVAGLVVVGLLVTGLGAWAAGTPAVVKVNRAKVRAQPSAHSEVLTHLKQGETVTVLAEQADPAARAGEPRQWARIEMPEHVPVWLAANLIDPKSKKVKVERINLRAGPGKNFSQLGQISKGTVVSEIRSEDGWMQIDAPAGCAAYMAVDLLATGPPRAATRSAAPRAPIAATPPPVVVNPKHRVRPEVSAPRPVEPVTPPVAPVIDEAVVEPNPARETLPTEVAPIEPALYSSVPVVQPASNPAIAQSRVARVESQPEPGPRVVNREGVVAEAWSVQAPSYLELKSFRRREGLMNFLFTDDPKIDLGPYRKKHVVLTGEEWVDARWPKTPILRVQKIEALDY